MMRNTATTTALAIILAFALLLCHGVLGAAHLPAEAHDRGSAAHASHAMNHGGHENHGGGGILSAHHEAEVLYFAVVSLFFLAAILFALRSKFEGSPSFVAAPTVGIPRNVPFRRLPRGPTLASLQVFRL